jgi:tetratricopeptide (TPR) repeat protein
MSERSRQDFERNFALMDRKQASSMQETAAEKNQYALLGANAYQAMRRFEEAVKAYRQYLNFDKTDAEAYANYAYCLVETGNPQEAILQFEASYKLRSDDIDALIGLFATNALLNDASKMRKYRRLAEAKLQHPLGVNTLDELGARGYFYSDKFRQVWRAALEQ